MYIPDKRRLSWHDKEIEDILRKAITQYPEVKAALAHYADVMSYGDHHEIKVQAKEDFIEAFADAWPAMAQHVTDISFLVRRMHDCAELDSFIAGEKQTGQSR